MPFEWDRMYKWEQNYERNITEDVEEYICEYYGVDIIEELTEEQLKEIEAFAEEYSFSIMRVGFSNVLKMIE